MKIFYFLTVTLFTLPGCTNQSDNKIEKPKNDTTAIVKTNLLDLVKDHQILLMNLAEFEKHTELYGASAFLIDYKNKVYAVTVSHLLGESGGVKPEIKVTELNKYFSSWKLFPRVPIDSLSDTVVVRNTKLNYDSLDKDILLLEVENKNFGALPLKPDFNLPKAGDKLYVIGCPYSEENCKQNIYQVTVDSYDADLSMIICVTPQTIEMPGFSGAPIVTAEGKVVGTIMAGWKENNMRYIGATFIKEIQKVK